MAVTITINGTERTRQIDWRSLKVKNVITSKIDTAKFKILWDTVSNTYKPTIGEVVHIEDNGTPIFEGPIISIEATQSTVKGGTYEIEATDYGRFLSRRVVTNVYEGQSIEAIFQDIIDNYTTGGFTLDAQNATFSADYVAFNYENVLDCFYQLCELASLDWYVDEDRVVHVFDKNVNAAPFTVTESNGNYVPSSLVLRDDNTQIRNQIFVRGGEYLGAQFTADMQANGEDFIFPLAYRYADFEATLTTTPLSIGVDYLDDPNDFDALYNFQEKILRFKEADTPSNGALMKIAGKPYIPVIVKVADREAQSQIAAAEGGDGVYEDVIIDKTIDTKQGARDRANAQIEQYKESITEGEFTTYTEGLRAGQVININLSSLGVNKNYIINQVIFQMRSPNEMQYQVSLISTKSFGILEWMQKQLRDEKKKIVINEDEILDTIDNAGATIKITESVSVQAVTQKTDEIGFADTFTAYHDSPPTWVAGPYSPTSISDRKRPMFTDVDCELGS